MLHHPHEFISTRCSELFFTLKMKTFEYKQIVLGVSSSVPLNHQLWLLKILDCDFSKPNPTDQMFSVEISKWSVWWKSWRRINPHTTGVFKCVKCEKVAESKSRKSRAHWALFSQSVTAENTYNSHSQMLSQEESVLRKQTLSACCAFEPKMLFAHTLFVEHV
jgi:hypothetical protein